MPLRDRKVIFRYAESMRSVFYTPVYGAITLGFCAQEGLEVEVYTCATGESTADLVARGRADAAQSSPSAALVAADKGESAFPLHFAQINHRDGFFILQRPGGKSFQWRDLEGAELLPASFAAQPWLSLRYYLKKQGVDSGKIKLTRYVNLHEAENAFRQGKGDFVHLPQPYAERLIVEGVGHLAASLGPAIGRVAFSSLIAARERVLRQDPMLVDFTRAFARALKWVKTASADELAKVVGPFFPDTDKEILARAAERYRSQETWAVNPVLSEEEFHVIQDIFLAGGEIRQRYPFEKIVDTTIARKVMEGNELI